MTTYQIIAAMLTMTAGFAFINYRFLKLAPTIGIMFLSLAVSIAIVLLEALGVLELPIDQILRQVDFAEVLMNGMLGYLLFAGALHVNLDDLVAQKWPVLVLSTLGVVVSTVLVGSGIYVISQWLGVGLSYTEGLVFGALISPTDPIAVIGVLKSAKAPKSLETKIVGESLFNDGIGVVVFMVILAAATSSDGFSWSHAGILFLEEAVGGLVLGFVLGAAAFWLLKLTNNYQVEILITLALVSGGYALAQAIHTSGPLVVVVAGLMVGNHGRRLAMSRHTREHLDMFWLLVDEILNALLFVLIGLEVLIMAFSGQLLLAGLLAVLITLLVRFTTIGAAVSILRRYHSFTPHATKIMTWSGLRGGISVALALTIAHGPGRNAILVMTYVVVVFSILVQGLTLKPLCGRLLSEKR